MCTHTHMLPSREIIFRPNRNKNKEGRASAAAALGHIVSVPLSAGSNEAVNTVFPCSPLCLHSTKLHLFRSAFKHEQIESVVFRVI